MHYCDIILIVAGLMLASSVGILAVTYKIGKDERRNRPCGGGRHNA